MDINGINLSDEDLRIIANTGQFYRALLVAIRDAQALPERMSWKTVSGADYPYEWRHEARQPKSRGRRGAETEALFSRFNSQRAAADERIASISARMASSLAQYRALRLPQIMALPARILRELDLRGDLGVNLIVVGTNAFAAYEIEARDALPAVWTRRRISIWAGAGGRRSPSRRRKKKPVVLSARPCFRH